MSINAVKGVEIGEGMAVDLIEFSRALTVRDEMSPDGL